jgi:rare lipoprotein A (peptidoglycan hydrolase)
MKRFSWFAWAIVVILALGFGTWAGHSITAAYKDVEIMDAWAALEAAQASLADANVELEQNKATVIAWDALASYYTEASSGGVQANGRRFDEDRLTAAHRSIPFGTLLILENPENGALSLVRIEDRGPAKWTGRSLDVSLAVAQRLGIVEKGVARLRCYALVEGRVGAGD